MSVSWRFSIYILLLALEMGGLSGFAQTVHDGKVVIPRRHSQPPGPALSPQEAIKKMTVPEGFAVELFAAEPDLVNPVAMTFDERGRVWVTESLEYPRRAPGPGKDRVRVLEDTNGDGKADKFTTFLEGLNIPSGIAIGHGGVWVANAPDLLFVQDTDGDGKADKQTVVISGFGRDDTHELPNSLTWGPDGWLYGLNGVFNPSHIKYGKENPQYQKVGGETHPGWKFTCAMFRIHPRTWEFQIFCEGTSNPWGIAFNDEGEAFVSACVIDHLWHLVETGYYHRQGGPYPPHTWKIESIVKHKHQLAAYCGIHWFDSDAYPEQYRKKLYMGNVHGGCINVDRLERNGSTYAGFPEPDFLTANDAWFMPVVQKTGPDGCLWILDWYDRYHCYQDANADPAGIDRLNGRLYRITYKGTKPAQPFDLGKKTDDELIELLGSGNGYLRDQATRLLRERNNEKTAEKLFNKFRNHELPQSLRRQLLFALAGFDRFAWAQLFYLNKHEPDKASQAFICRQLGVDEMTVTAFTANVTKKGVKPSLPEGVDPAVALQAVILYGKLKSDSPNILAIWLLMLGQFENDPLIPKIVWQNLHPRLETQAGDFIALLEREDYLKSDGVAKLMPRVADRILARKDFDAKLLARLFDLLATGKHPQPEIAAQFLQKLTARVQSKEIAGANLDALKTEFLPKLQPLFANAPDAAFLAASWSDPQGLHAVKVVLANPGTPPEKLLAAIESLIAAKDPDVLKLVQTLFSNTKTPAAFRGQVLAAIGRMDDPQVATLVLNAFPQAEPDLQARAIEVLTQRAMWAKPLLAAIGEKKIPVAALNENQVRKLIATGDKELAELVRKHWGVVREGRSPDREKVIADMRVLVRTTPGDPFRGEQVFKKLCAQCHKIHGEGTDVGPDITSNGRNNYNQLLSNIFDPSLVIGSAYQSWTVITEAGRVITGLLVEESPERVVLKIQGGKQEVIARNQIDTVKRNELSLMPEGIEKQHTPQQIADLMAFLVLDKHPKDPTAKPLPGIREVTPRETMNAADFAAIFQEVAPGFTAVTSGDRGVGLLREYLGQPAVVRTHPVAKDIPGIASGQFKIPENGPTVLEAKVSHDAQGDWRLVIRVDGESVFTKDVSQATVKEGWLTARVDLSKFAGKTVKIELLAEATGWAFEFAYWQSVRLITAEPQSVSQLLQKKIDVSFNRTPLQEALQAIGSHINVAVQIDGDGLKFQGYTKNMPVTFELNQASAEEVIKKVIAPFNKMYFEVDEASRTIIISAK